MAMPVDEEEERKPFADIVHQYATWWAPICKPQTDQRDPWTCMAVRKCCCTESTSDQISSQGQTISVIGAISQTSSGTCEWKCHSTCTWGIDVASGTVTFLLIKRQVDFDDEILVAKNILDRIDHQVGVTGLSFFRKGLLSPMSRLMTLRPYNPKSLQRWMQSILRRQHRQHQHYVSSISIAIHKCKVNINKLMYNVSWQFNGPEKYLQFNTVSCTLYWQSPLHFVLCAEMRCMTWPSQLRL